MKKILLVKEPLINTYNSYGFLFSIIPEGMMPWVYDNFIQLVYGVDWNMLMFENHEMFLEKCPGITYYMIPKRMISRDENGIAMKKMITDTINNNDYLLIYIDRYYLSFDSKYYHTHHLQHELLIYGYDDDVLYIADYSSNGKYIFAQCTFNELYDGYFNMQIDENSQYMGDVRILHVDNNIKYEINMQQMEYALNAFLDSKTSFYLNKVQEQIFGMKVFNILSERVKKCEKENCNIDIRSFHLLYEHILLMRLRVKYLIENNYFISKCSYEEELSKLLNDAFLLRNLTVKYNIARDCKLIERIINKIENLKIEEYKLFSSLKEEISKMAT